jgi:hypothetical protein
MSPTLDQAVHVPVILSRHCVSSTERAAIRATVARGKLVRIARGAYVESAAWRKLDRHARYRTLVYAAAEMNTADMIFTHASAALLWRLPWVDSWPSQVHVAAELPAAGGTSTKLLSRHAFDRESDSVRLDGLRASSLGATVVDIAADLKFAPAVAIADAALRRMLVPVIGLPETSIDRDLLMSMALELPLNHGRAKAIRVVQFADGRADRPGESLSRVTMFRAGITSPELQVELRGASGRRYFVDFWWPEFNAFGEFDGKYKYSDPEFLAGRTPSQAVYDEKLREDDLRAPGRGCARWGWAEARSIPLLRARLTMAGIR